VKLQIPTARVFSPLLAPSRYKAAHGGRGSGKSRFFAGLAIETAYLKPGARGVCIREVQKALKESAKLLIEDRIAEFGCSRDFNPLKSETKTPNGGLIIYRGMNDYTADSIKSLEDFDWAWIEEAQTFSARSLELLRPTMRKPGSELWFGWNPRNPGDPVDSFFRGLHPPENAVIVQANYADNPWFPAELEAERLHDEKHNRDRYGHIWLGQYEPMVSGAMWDRLTFHNYRVHEIPPDLERIVVAVDPAVSAETGSDEHGIVAAGMSPDKRIYVIRDASLRGTPRQWAERAIATYDEFSADAIVVERNQGGDMVKHTLKTIRPDVRIIEVVATRGKHVRAEPIAAIYSQGRVSHVGTLTRLEDQYCQTTAAGYEGNGSPDAMDAAVWAITELMKPLRQASHGNVNWDETIGSGRGWLGS
jgi:phage terminase large subunit-like protein